MSARFPNFVIEAQPADYIQRRNSGQERRLQEGKHEAMSPNVPHQRLGAAPAAHGC
jgi:hypothetical protein